MNIKNKNFLSLIIWVMAFILIGATIGFLTKAEISSWYNSLNLSSLTPPDYIFPIAWTFLYAIIAFCGWTIWSTLPFSTLKYIKRLYIIQLLLNWSWSPLFFYFHLTDISLISLLAMDIIVGKIIYLGYVKIKSVSLLMSIYLLWILFATYLNFYIWYYN